MQKHEQLSILNARLRNLEGEQATLVYEISHRQGRLHNVQRRVKEVKRKVKVLLEKDIEITDHAILRYQERVEFIPPQEIRERILTDNFKKIVDTLGPS